MEPSTNKTLGQLLTELMGKNEYERFKKRMRAVYECDMKSIEAPLNIPKPNEKGNDYRKYLQCAQILHLIYNIPLKNLNVSYKEVHHEQYTGESKTQWLRDEEEYRSTGLAHRLTGKAFKDVYLSVCKAPLESVKSSLAIYDYLGKTDIQEPNSLDAYFEANSTLYKIIEKKLDEIEGFEYIRFLALPFDLSSKLNPDNFSTNKLYYEEAVACFIQFCPLVLLTHICNCLKKFDPIFTNPRKKTGFYIVPHPPRAHHFAILDSDKTFGEYYRCNNEGINRPDLLFLESNNETQKFLHQVYSWEKKMLLKAPKRKRKLDLNILKKISPRVLADAQKKYDQIIKELENDNDDDESITDKAEYAEIEYNETLAKYQHIQEI